MSSRTLASAERYLHEADKQLRLAMICLNGEVPLAAEDIKDANFKVDDALTRIEQHQKNHERTH